MLFRSVGLRSVFRHFKDMDSLFREISHRIEREASETFLRPISGDTVKARLDDLALRRCALFERISPFYIAAQAHRARSEFLNQDAQKNAQILRDLLKQVLNPAIIARTERFEALDALLSPSTWVRLRREQGLSIDQARAVVQQTAQLLIQ